MRTARHAKIKISLAVSDFLPSVTVFPFMIYYLIKNFGSSNPTSDMLLDMVFESQSSIWVNVSGNLKYLCSIHRKKILYRNDEIYVLCQKISLKT